MSDPYPYPYGQPSTYEQPTMPPYPTEGDQETTASASRSLFPYPYGWYAPASPGFPTTDVGPQQSRRGLIIGVIVAVLALALIGGGAVVGVNQYQAPANAAEQFCSALKAEDYMAAYALLSSGLQAQSTPAEFTMVSQALDRAEGNVTTCGEAAGNAYNHTLFGSTATISFIITRAQIGSLSGRLHLVDNSGWKISGIDTSLLRVNLASLQALASYCTALKQQNYATAYSYLGNTLVSKVSQSTFSQQAALHEQVDGAITGCGITGLGSGNDDTMTNLVVSITRGTLGRVSGTVSLDLESGSWKLTSIASQLEGSDLGGLAVIQQFCAYIKAGEPDKAYLLSTSSFRAVHSQSEFNSAFGIAGVSYDCTLRLPTYKVTGGINAQITGAFTLSEGGAEESVPTVFLAQKSGTAWKILSLELS